MALRKNGIRNKYNNRKFVQSVGEDYTGVVSETIEGEAIPLDQFVARYTRGDIPPMAQSAFNNLDMEDEIPPFYQDNLERSQSMLDAQNELEYLAQQAVEDREEIVQEENANDDNEQNEKEEANKEIAQ